MDRDPGSLSLRGGATPLTASAAGASAPARGLRCRLDCPGGGASGGRRRRRCFAARPAKAPISGRLVEIAIGPGAPVAARLRPSPRGSGWVVSDRTLGPDRRQTGRRSCPSGTASAPPGWKDGREHDGNRRRAGGFIDVRRDVAVQLGRTRRGKALSRRRATRCNCERPS
jgi:hypothetical protein